MSRQIWPSLRPAGSFRDGDADAMVVGATGTALTCVTECTNAVDVGCCKSPTTTCVAPLTSVVEDPFPEKALGSIVLEEMHSALRRGASIYGEILGAASASCIGQDRFAIACRNGLANAMRQTLQRADLVPEQHRAYSRSWSGDSDVRHCGSAGHSSGVW
jgi:hypothetical protein